MPADTCIQGAPQLRALSVLDSIVAESSSLPSTHLQEPVPQQTNCILGDSNSSPTDPHYKLRNRTSIEASSFHLPSNQRRTSDTRSKYGGIQVLGSVLGACTLGPASRFPDILSDGLSFSTFASQRHAVPLPAISSVHFKSNSSQHSQEKIAGYNGNTYTFRLNSLSFVPNIQIFILLYISLKNS